MSEFFSALFDFAKLFVPAVLFFAAIVFGICGLAALFVY